MGRAFQVNREKVRSRSAHPALLNVYQAHRRQTGRPRRKGCRTKREWTVIIDIHCIIESAFVDRLLLIPTHPRQELITKAFR
jgi:hypothetical protein